MAISDRRFARRVGIVLALSAVAFLGVAVVVFAFQFFLVVFAGILLAVLLDGAASRVERHLSLPRAASLVLVIATILAAGTGFWWIVGPMVAQQLAELGERIPEAVEAVEGWVAGIPWAQDLLAEAPSPMEFLMGGGVMGQVTGIFSTIFGVVINVVVILFVGIYGAARPNLYIDNGLYLVPREHRGRARDVLAKLGRALRYWFLGQFIAMVAVGLLTGIGLTLLGAPLPGALGFLAFLLEFIPYLGPVLAFIPVVLVALMESPELALWVGIFFIGVQQLESYVVTPMAQQFAVSMPPALLIVGQILFGLMGGLMGVILATPVVISVVVLVQTLYVEDVVGDDVKPLGTHESSEED